MDVSGESVVLAGNQPINVKGMSGGQVENMCVAGVVYGGMGNKSVIETTSLDTMIGYSTRLMNSINMEMYVSTKTERSAKKFLEENGCILITGKSGTGKTTIGLRLLSQVSEQTGRHPFVLTSPRQLDLLPLKENISEKGQKYLVMIDNIFGSTNFVKSHLDKWESVFDMIWTCIESGLMLLVLTSRHDIYQQCDKLVSKYAIFKSAENLLLDGTMYALSADERKRLIRRYGGSQFSETQLLEIVDSSTDLVFGFPLCCKMFADSHSVQMKGVSFFRNPREEIISEIARLKQNDQLAFFTLLLVLSKDSCLEMKFLTPPISEEFQCLLGEVRQFCNLDVNPTLNAIREKAKQLCGIYLFGSKVGFHFQHQSILDAVVLSISQDYLNLFIQVCPIGVLLEFVRLHSESEVKNERIICLPECLHSSLAKRFTELVSNQKSSYILGHQALSDETFNKVLVDMWLDEDIIKIISLELEEKTIVLDTFDIDVVSRYKPYSDLHGLFNMTQIFKFRCLVSHLIMYQSPIVSLVDDEMEKIKSTLSADVLKEILCCAIYVGSWSIAHSLFTETEPFPYMCLRVLVCSPEYDEDLTQQAMKQFNLHEIQQKELYTLLSLAVQFGKCSIITWLTKKIRPEQKHKSLFSKCLIQLLLQSTREIRRKSQFLSSTSRQITSIIKILFIKGYTYDSMTLLCLAAGHDDSSSLKFILHNLQKFNLNDSTSLHFNLACQYGSIECVKEFLVRGINMYTTGARNRSFRNCVDGVEHTADDDPYFGESNDFGDNQKPISYDCDSYSESMYHDHLHLAIQSQSDSFKKVKLLLTAMSKDYETQIARRRSSFGISCDITTLLEDESMFDRKSKFECINDSDIYGCKPLHYAAIQGNANIVKLLLKVGAKINCKDGWGFTPMMCAAIGNKPQCFQMFRKRKGVVPNMKKQDLLSHLIFYFLGSDTLSPFNSALKHYKIRRKGVNVKAFGIFFEIFQDKADYPDLIDSEGRSALLKSVQSENTEVVKFLLSSGANANFKDYSGQSVLHIAARYQSCVIFQHLCENGADVNILDSAGHTVLHEATKSINEALDKIEYMMKVKNVSLTADCKGRTALFPAVESGNTDIVQILAHNGLSVNHCDAKGASLLHVACSKHAHDSTHTKLLTALIDLHINISFQNENGHNALHLACLNGCLKCVQFLLTENFTLQTQDMQGRSPLHLAADSGVVEIVQVFQETSQDYIKQDKDGKTPLHIAVENNHVSVIDFLLKETQLCNTKDDKGRTPLLCAIQMKHVEAAMIFLERGLNICDQDNEGTSPLIAAAKISSLKICDRLIKTNARVSSMNRNGQSVLHIAAAKPSHEIVKLLIAASCSINAQDQEGKSPLHIAVINEQITIVNVLLKHDVNINLKDATERSALHYSCLLSNGHILKELVSHGGDTGVTDKSSKTLLHCAVLIDNHEAAAYLLESSMLISAEDDEGNTAVHLAAQNGSVKCLDLLLNSGADISKQNYQGRTPFYLASNGDYFVCVKQLIDNGADISAPSKVYKAGIQSGNENTCTTKSRRVNKMFLRTNARAVCVADCDSDDSTDVPLEEGLWDDIINKHPKPELLSADDDLLLPEPVVTNFNPFLARKIPSKMKTTNSNIETRLHAAAKNGDVNEVKHALKKGGCISAKDAKGKTALHYAAERGESDIIQFILLQSETEKSIQDKIGLTPSHIAAQMGRYVHLKMLILSGADINVQDKDGSTPLHYAAENGDFDTVELLLSNGCKRNLKNKQNRTALDITRKYNFFRCASVLYQNVPKVPKELTKVSLSAHALSQMLPSPLVIED